MQGFTSMYVDVLCSCSVLSFEDNWPALMQWCREFRILTTVDAEQEEGDGSCAHMTGWMLTGHLPPLQGECAPEYSMRCKS